MSPVSNVKDVSGLYRGKPPPTWALRCSYIVCLAPDQCGRGLAPDEAGTDAAAITAIPRTDRPMTVITEQ